LSDLNASTGVTSLAFLFPHRQLKPEENCKVYHSIHAVCSQTRNSGCS
jgi:hypothetical protein